MRVEEVAEAVTAAFLSIRMHLREGSSLKSALYSISRSLKPSLNALRLARKILYFYAIESYRVSSLLRRVIRDEVSSDAIILLTILLTSIRAGIDLGDLEDLVRALRRAMKNVWPRDAEPWLGLIRVLPDLEPIPDKSPSYPPWFTRMLYRVLGRGEALRLMTFQNEAKPRMYVVLNTLIAAAEEILEQADRAGVKLSRDGRIPGIYLLERAEDTRRLAELVRRSLLLIQDFSSYYAVYAAHPKPGQIVLDVCAAPGSKTILAGLMMRNRGLIVSIDSSIRRLYTHLRRIRKAGLRIVEDVAADATIQLPLNLEADLAILDPPCSSTGLFWREPMYRQLIKPRHVKMFAKLQAKMLESVAPHIKVGGTLVYSTCSLSLEENELLLEDFLKKHPEYELISVDPVIGSPGLRGMDSARRLYPHRDYCNGFFLAKLRRIW